MKKIIILYYIFVYSFAFVYSHTEVDTMQTVLESDCEANLENIFKVYDLKRKHNIVEHIFKEGNKRKSVLFSNYNYGHLNYLFEFIRGVPYFDPKDSILTVDEIKPIKVEYMSEEAVNEYIEKLDFTPAEAYRNYYNFIRDIKLKKNTYLKCIEMELAKNFDSKYTEDMVRYEVIKAPPSLSHFPVITKLHFLKLFKEFIFIDDEAVLPDYFRALVYLDCGCKTTYFKEYSSKYEIKNE